MSAGQVENVGKKLYKVARKTFIFRRKIQAQFFLLRK